jgi:hypothetical protein
MKSTSSRRVTSSDGMVEERVDGRIEMCWSGIEFDCCQGEVLVVAIWAASGNRKSVSLADSSRWRRNVRKTAEKGLRGRKGSGLGQVVGCKSPVSESAGAGAGTDDWTKFWGCVQGDSVKVDTRT